MRSTSAAILIVFLYVPMGTAQTQPLGQTQTLEAGAVRETIGLTFPEDREMVLKFRGTSRLPRAHGYATVQREKGSTGIEMYLNNMKPASLFGGDFSTYVLWVVSPEGQVQNLGEFVLEGDESELRASTNLNAFGMFVTAEPHYLVSLPSRFVVLETTKTLADKSEGYPTVAIRYRGFEGLYNYERDTLVGTKEANGLVENDVKQAMAAVQIAERAGANEFARAELDKARTSLQNTLAIAEQRKSREELDTAARKTVGQAVAAQKLAEDRAYQAALESERRTRDEQLAELERKYEEAADEADQAQLKREQDQTKLQLDVQAREDALRRAVEEQRLRLAVERRAAEAAHAKATIEGRAREIDAAAQKALRERQESYLQMREALGRVAETRESVRGLIVNIPDGLFDSDSPTLRPEGRERLKKIASIILATPGTWSLSVEGHTDSVGSDSYNQTLSERLAEAVRSYLVAAGVSSDTVTAKGFGASRPIASNVTNENRQRSRRVEIIIEDRLKISSH